MKALRCMILLLIASINGGISASEEPNVSDMVKTRYIPTAVSYVSFVKHIVPKRVEQSSEHSKLPTRAPFNHYIPTRNFVQTDQSSMAIAPPTKKPLHNYYNEQTAVARDHTMSYHSTGIRPAVNDYHPTYPTIGYAEPIFVQSRIPLSPRPVSGNRERNSPMVIGVQQPAYVKKYVQYGPPNPSSVRKTLTYAPKLAYIPHNYQRV
ncbi:uncharacterized protein LOC126567476 [Anopheles maculipalpis]|uniref:uncharacterized protein LOC126567476 n=1 Tax=Anopheles maculipalpis TaxID=1496333 RepID=UPI002158E663|nr:uncharacterized protein LOC126567476 [Anopheles maculipalpis]